VPDDQRRWADRERGRLDSEARGREITIQRGVTDLGPSLRKVRAARGLTLEEAARDTRIRREFLDAIENEDYERLLGDVHVRGCLRTYASYLRLSPDRVVDAYADARPEPLPTITPPPAQPEPVMGVPRRRDDHRLFLMVAAMLLVLAAAFGVLSARQSAPPPADLPSVAPPLEMGSARPITVAVLAEDPVEVTIESDGGPAETFALAAGEGRTFEGDRVIRVRLSEGGVAEVTVNGTDYGVVGREGRPWQRTFEYETASPSS
jgi:DNA-binding XRE family transcriptional regulator